MTMFGQRKRQLASPDAPMLDTNPLAGEDLPTEELLPDWTAYAYRELGRVIPCLSYSEVTVKIDLTYWIENGVRGEPIQTLTVLCRGLRKQHRVPTGVGVSAGYFRLFVPSLVQQWAETYLPLP